ncbi:hypothetical protein [Actinomadura meridiana]|uniref:hypothetical protein n=1 Tax=Actinomadura meridiana TaxID=559626 RepID=UPI0031EA709E
MTTLLTGVDDHAVVIEIAGLKALWRLARHARPQRVRRAAPVPQDRLARLYTDLTHVRANAYAPSHQHARGKLRDGGGGPQVTRCWPTSSRAERR